MVYRRFYAGIVVIALLMGLVSYAAAWSVYREYQLVTSVSLFLAWGLLIAIMIRHVNRTNRELSSFLVTLQAGDTSNLFDTEGTRGLQKKLFTSFNSVILAFRELKIRKEQEQLLLQSTVDQTGAGILVLDPPGQVEICNRTFRELLNTGTFTHLGDLSASHPRLHRIIKDIQPGEQHLVELIISDPKSFEPDDRKQVVINAREIVIEDRKLKVLTFQNIQSEIEQRESDAWEKLLRVFSHEIMNSVSPINLLTASLIEMFKESSLPGDLEKDDAAGTEQALLALETIRKRGKGLVDFVESYRSITRIPEPVVQDVSVRDFLEEVITLMKPDLDHQGILIEYEISPVELVIRADESLLQQVMINLFRNAADALVGTEAPVIRIAAFLSGERPVLSVSDNGTGIPPEIMDKIFTPFYTSKKEGSGIGLSFARQVMRLHHGRITAGPVPQGGSVFTLYF